MRRWRGYLTPAYTRVHRNSSAIALPFLTEGPVVSRAPAISISIRVLRTLTQARLFGPHALNKYAIKPSKNYAPNKKYALNNEQRLTTSVYSMLPPSGGGGGSLLPTQLTCCLPLVGKSARGGEQLSYRRFRLNRSIEGKLTW